MALSASDVPAMYQLLANSLSGDVIVRKPAETALSQSESRTGFCSCLMEIITAKDLAAQVDVRMMATVYFKNSINRYWRTRRDSVGITGDEKVYLRQKLLSYLREENDKIALMLAVLVSKIARFDYPKEWSDLFTVLAQQLQSADVLSSHRIFLILFRILKELSAKRLTSDQRNYAEISSHFFDYCWRLWQTDVQNILRGFSELGHSYSSNDLNEHQNELRLVCERWYLCLKIIRQLTISGHQSDSKSMQEVRQVKEVAPMLLSAIQSFLPFYSSFRDRHPNFWDFIKRACTKMMKVLIAFQERHPYSFGDRSVLSPVIDFCLDKITNPDAEILPFEQFLIQSMILVKSTVECKDYSPRLTGRVVDESAITLEERKKNISSAVASVVTSLFPNERVILLCNVLIRRYFVLSASDLEEWNENPEAFHHEQDMVQWTEKLRPCAEALYIVLFHKYYQMLGPVVVSILKEAMEGCSASVTEISSGLLLKDAAYGAAAYVYYELSNYLSFNDWFNGALSLELTNNHPNMRIIHRKVALILGQWVSEIRNDTKRPVYCAAIKLLQDKDLAVRLAACRTLSLLIEDSNFSEKDFSDLLPVCWGLCFNLVEEVQEFDSKVQVLYLISVLLGIGQVIPYADKLMQFFYKVWEESSGESLLQIQLLIALKNFVTSLGYQSPICYNMLLPILQRGIDVNGPDELNLLEDSMLLWEATLTYAPSMVPQLLDLFPSLLAIIERSFDHLTVAIEIIEDYIILGGPEFLSRHASSVATLLDMIVGNVNDKGLLKVLPIVDILVMCYPAEVPPLLTNTLQKLFVACLCGGEEREPSKTAVKSSSAAILARILVMNTNYLAQLTSEPSLLLLLQGAGFPVEENILLCLVDIWLDKVDNMTSLQRKTIGLALSIILSLRLSQVLDKLDQILSVCTSVIMGGHDDLSEGESSGDMASIRSQIEETVPSKEFKKRQIKASDPINQMSLESAVKENLQTCAAVHGDSFNAVISRMHPTAVEQMKQALKMP